MNQAVAVKKESRSIMVTMAHRYGMEAGPFEATLMKTVMPQKYPPTREEVAAFLVVAREYELNPLIREIFAFPKRGGGIQPIVSVDGWMTLINRQPNMDGMEFADHLDEDNNLLAVTCRIHRKDRSHPTEVIEYMDECKPKPGDKPTPWDRWPKRMLRHKAAIQAARYAFGLSGIMDEDEYHRMESISEPEVPMPPPVPVLEEQELMPPPAPSEYVEDPLPPTEEMVAVDPDVWLDGLDMDMQACSDRESLEHVWASYDTNELAFPPDKDRAVEIFDRHLKRIDA